MNPILIVDDDMDMCQLLSRFLQRKGFETDMAYTGSKGLAKFREQQFDVVLCDFRLGDKDGIEVLKEIKSINPQAVVIIITGYSDIKAAVEVMKHGAFDYITKPLIPDELLNLINKALHESVPPVQVATPSGKVPVPKIRHNSGPEMDGEFLVGKSGATQELYSQMELIAPTNYSIIIYGESGTGKEVVAKTIHQASNRKDKPFVALDCGTISKELAGSELFGHMKGSFTGALSDKEGLFEVVDGGTLFLDEVGNLSLDVQATLLRVIQERKFKRVGGNKEIGTDVRLIVASNENLQDAYRSGKFREDLYHRFNEFAIHIPPLRNRKEDIPLFAEFFLRKTSNELNKHIEGFEEEVLQLFLEYSWPGNLREFRNVVRRAGLLTPSGLISTNALPWEIISGAPMPGIRPDGTKKDTPLTTDLKDAASQAEYETIMNVLKQVKFNKTKAAEVLNIDRKTLYNKLKLHEEFKDTEP